MASIEVPSILKKGSLEHDDRLGTIEMEGVYLWAAVVLAVVLFIE
jgi:hypothetical protein